jgi:beta-lactamase superfamily II metal-dependent hydrolase
MKNKLNQREDMLILKKCFKRTLLLFLLSSVCIISYADEQALPKWQEGMLDIHFIDTGRGNAAFYIFPDGTTMLVDAGDMSDEHPRTLSERQAPRMPNASKTAPQWIVMYIKQFGPKGQDTILDYALMTHWHDDHFGELANTSKLSDNKAYKLVGITEVGDAIPIKLLMDRGYDIPLENGKPDSLTDSKWQEKFVKEDGDDCHLVSTINEYVKFIDYQSANNGMKHEVFDVGSDSQVVLNYKRDKYPDFKVGNLTGNGNVWTGENKDIVNIVKRWDENNLSCSFKINYGDFKFFTGGDINGVDSLSMPNMNRVEAQIAPLIGPVDIATLNHHGNRDSNNPNYVRTVRSRVWIGQTWSSDHPGDDTLRRLTSTLLYPNDRDLFSTAMLEANKLVIGDLIDTAYKAQKGHIVVRVFPGGKNYKVYVLDSSKETNPRIAQFDYKAR